MTLRLLSLRFESDNNLSGYFYCTAPKTRWDIITQIPPMLVANLYTSKFQRDKKEMQRKNGSKKVLFAGETNGVEHQ
jgi:uncharacterized protein YbaR (Trm112 family)